MIYDTLDHIEQYKTTHPRLYRALTILRDTDFSRMADGRVEVEGSDLYYMLQSYESKENSSKVEAHRAYADIQMVLTGREKMGIAPLEAMVRVTEAKPEKDCWLYEGPVQYLAMVPGTFAVLFPGDAHAPGLALEASEPVRKCVFKVKL